MLSNAYFLAKFRFDTAENEPAKNLQNFAKFANFADSNPLTRELVTLLQPAGSDPHDPSGVPGSVDHDLCKAALTDTDTSQISARKPQFFSTRSGKFKIQIFIILEIDGDSTDLRQYLEYMFPQFRYNYLKILAKINGVDDKSAVFSAISGNVHWFLAKSTANVFEF